MYRDYQCQSEAYLAVRLAAFIRAFAAADATTLMVTAW